MFLKKTLICALVFPAYISFSGHAFSQVRDNITINAPKSSTIKASTKGWSILELAGKKIKYADTSNGECEINAKRSLELGKLVFKPISKEGFILFVTDTENQTYPIEVNPSDKVNPGLLKVHDKLAEAKDALLQSQRIKQLKSSVKIIDLAESRKKAITDLMTAMLLNDAPRNADIADRNEIVYFWNEANILHTKRYTVGVLDGDVYQLTNTSNSDMVLEEKEFYSLGKNVSSVSLSTNRVKPGQTINVYIVRAHK